MTAKNISTLVSDIYKELETRGGWDQAITEYFMDLMRDFAETRRQTQEEEADTNSEPYLRMSAMGKPCKRSLWYSMNMKDQGEKFLPSTLLKFNYGDIIEALVLTLAKAAGHKVEGEQDTLYVEGIKGHRDAVIDGITIDVKSTSSYGYKKFLSGGLRDDDPFGYISQLSSYVYAGRDNEVESHDSLGAFLAIDKQNGTICLDMYDFGPELDRKADEFAEIKEMVKQPEPPERAFSDEPDGKSGNRKLCVNCSYCGFNKTCWPKARKFLYSNGPRFLTEVVREPRDTVREIK